MYSTTYYCQPNGNLFCYSIVQWWYTNVNACLQSRVYAFLSTNWKFCKNTLEHTYYEYQTHIRSCASQSAAASTDYRTGRHIARVRSDGSWLWFHRNMEICSSTCCEAVGTSKLVRWLQSYTATSGYSNCYSKCVIQSLNSYLEYGL